MIMPPYVFYVLFQLIMSMAENRAYVPARVTKLTHILKPKIGKKCDTR